MPNLNPSPAFVPSASPLTTSGPEPLRSRRKRILKRGYCHESPLFCFLHHVFLTPAIVTSFHLCIHPGPGIAHIPLSSIALASPRPVHQWSDDHLGLLRPGYCSHSGPAIVLTPARPLSHHIGTSYCSIVLLLDTQPRTLHIYSGSLVHSFLSLSTSSTHCSVAPCTVVADSLTAILYLILSAFSSVPVCDLGGCLVTPDTNPDSKYDH